MLIFYLSNWPKYKKKRIGQYGHQVENSASPACHDFIYFNDSKSISDKLSQFIISQYMSTSCSIFYNRIIPIECDAAL